MSRRLIKLMVDPADHRDISKEFSLRMEDRPQPKGDSNLDGSMVAEIVRDLWKLREMEPELMSKYKREPGTNPKGGMIPHGNSGIPQLIPTKEAYIVELQAEIERLNDEGVEFCSNLKAENATLLESRDHYRDENINLWDACNELRAELDKMEAENKRLRDAFSSTVSIDCWKRWCKRLDLAPSRGEGETQ